MKAWRASPWVKYILLSQVLWYLFWLLGVFIYLLLHEKAGLKLNIQKPKIMVSSHITSSQIGGKKQKQWQILLSWAPKSLWTVTAAMKLKYATHVCMLSDVWKNNHFSAGTVVLTLSSLFSEPFEF